MVVLYSVFSQTARELAKRLSIPILYKPTTNFFDIVIRWGKNGIGPLSKITNNHAPAVYKATKTQLNRIVLLIARIKTPPLRTHKFPCIGRPA